jgi:hypothetical protein
MGLMSCTGYMTQALFFRLNQFARETRESSEKRRKTTGFGLFFSRFRRVSQADFDNYICK